MIVDACDVGVGVSGFGFEIASLLGSSEVGDRVLRVSGDGACVGGSLFGGNWRRESHHVKSYSLLDFVW